MKYLQRIQIPFQRWRQLPASDDVSRFSFCSFPHEDMCKQRSVSNSATFPNDDGFSIAGIL